MALDATVGGAAANSYLTLEVAEAYMLGRLSVEDWDAADEHEREAALIMATARLDAESYVGCPVILAQRLQWPRYGAYDRNGNLLVTTAIPAMLQDATCELALSLLGDPGMLDGTTGLSEFSHLSTPSLDLTPRHSVVGSLPSHVKRLIAPIRLGGIFTHVVRA